MGEGRSCCPGIKAGQDNSTQKAPVAIQCCRSQTGSQWDPAVPKSAASLPHCPTLPSTTWMGFPSHPPFPAPKVPPQTPNRNPVLLGKQNSFSLLPQKISCWDGGGAMETHPGQCRHSTGWLPVPAPAGSQPAAELSGSSQSSPGRPDPIQLLVLPVGSAQPLLS